MIAEHYNSYDAKVDRSLPLQENTAYDLEHNVSHKNGMDVITIDDNIESINSMEEGFQNIIHISYHTYHKVASNNSELNGSSKPKLKTKTVEIVQNNDRIVQGCESNEIDPLQNVTRDISDNKSKYIHEGNWIESNI